MLRAVFSIQYSLSSLVSQPFMPRDGKFSNGSDSKYFTLKGHICSLSHILLFCLFGSVFTTVSNFKNYAQSISHTKCHRPQFANPWLKPNIEAWRNSFLRTRKMLCSHQGNFTWLLQQGSFVEIYQWLFTPALLIEVAPADIRNKP